MFSVLKICFQFAASFGGVPPVLSLRLTSQAQFNLGKSNLSVDTDVCVFIYRNHLSLSLSICKIAVAQTVSSAKKVYAKLEQ